MPKPFLIDEDSRLESDLIETFLAGHHEWRPDLLYPESHSDMCGGIRALLRMYEIKRRPIAKPLRILCHLCDGAGRFTELVEASEDGTCSHVKEKICPTCNGKKYLKG